MYIEVVDKFYLVLQITREGEILPFYQQEMKVGGDGVEDRIFFIWPTTIVHKITPDSPLYKLSAADMLQERFEIVVILEGMVYAEYSFLNSNNIIFNWSKQKYFIQL